MRVFLGVHGSGLGHASRTLLVASRLAEEGDAIHFSSSREAMGFITGQGYACDEVPLIDVGWSRGGRLSALVTSRNFLPDSLRFSLKVRLQIRHMQKFRPDAVLSDSSLSTVIAGKALSKRVVSVLNQLRIVPPESVPHAIHAVAEQGSELIIGGLWLESDRVLIPDLPPPYTISERNLRAASGERKIRSIGFLASRPTPFEARLTKVLGPESRTKVYWPISGPRETRSAFFRAALEIASKLGQGPGGRLTFLINVATRDGEERVSKVPGGWVFHTFGEAGRNELLQACDLVVSRAGHTSIAEFIHYQKPSILVPIPNQTEQHGNGAKAAALGISVTLGQELLSPEVLSEAVEEVGRRNISRRLEQINGIASAYDAPKSVVAELGAAR